MAIVTGSYGGIAHETRNQEATVWIGGLETQVNEEIVFELMLQAGPVKSVAIPKDKVSSVHQGFAFCEFEHVEDAEYAIRIMNNIKLFGKPIRVNRSSKEHGTEEWMANLFVGNLDPEVDDKVLYDTFAQFGCVLSASVMKDPETNKSKGFGFVTFDCFEASDAAIEALHGQYLCNRQLAVSYAFKKDGSKGERHGSPEERALAARQGRKYEKPSAGSNATTSAFTHRLSGYPLASSAPPPVPFLPPSSSSSSLPPPPPLPPYMQPYAPPSNANAPPNSSSYGAPPPLPTNYGWPPSQPQPPHLPPHFYPYPSPPPLPSSMPPPPPPQHTYSYPSMAPPSGSFAYPQQPPHPHQLHPQHPQPPQPYAAMASQPYPFPPPPK